jgi:hypothetical protein
MIRHFGLILCSIVSLVFIYPAYAVKSAKQCLQDAKQAQASGSSQLVITMEGLMGGFDGRAAKLARTSLSKSGLDANVAAFSHLNSSLAAQCANAWKKVHGDKLRITFIGHSFGGGLGAMPALKEMAGYGITVQNLVILDGRTGSEVVCGANGGPTFEKPENVEKVISFCQCGFMPGRSFEPGENVENITVYGTSHINLPGSKVAKDRVTELFREEVLIAGSQSEVTPAQIEPSVVSRPPTISRPQTINRRKKTNGLHY